MRRFDTFSDRRDQSYCFCCLRPFGAEGRTIDHVPPRALLLQPYPSNLITVFSCQQCNNQSSFGEELVTVALEMALPKEKRDVQRERKYQRVLERPEKQKMAGFVNRVLSQGIDGHLGLSDSEIFSKFFIKLARAHCIFDIGANQSQVVTNVFWSRLDRKNSPGVPMGELEGTLFPEVGSEHFLRIFESDEIDENGWVIYQRGVYRYRLTIARDGVLVEIVLREFLSVYVEWKNPCLSFS